MANRIHVYLHVAGIGYYREVVAEIMGQLSGSGLYDAAASITFCMVGAKGSTTVSYLTWPKVLHEWGGDLDEWEYPTLRLLWRQACKEPDARYLYLHTKGVSRPDRKFCNSWRRAMTHRLIERWRECLIELDTHDTCGIYHIHRPTGHAHYSGNFWWARGDYLARLTYPEPRPIDQHPRMFAEIWLLTGEGTVQHFGKVGPPVGVNRMIGRDLDRVGVQLGAH